MNSNNGSDDIGCGLVVLVFLLLCILFGLPSKSWRDRVDAKLDRIMEKLKTEEK